MQADNLSVVKKHENYQDIKAVLTGAYKDMCKTQLILFTIATVNLVALIWNIMQIGSEPFWLSIVELELNV